MARERDLFYKFVRFKVRWLFFGPLGGLSVVHRGRVPESGPVILAPNHVSFLDPPAVACSSRRHLRFMAQHDLFKSPIFGWLIRRLGSFPVRRGKADTTAIRTALRVLQNGEALLVFPEGGRGDGRTLQSANKGVTLLALMSGAAVVPVGICNTDRMMPKGAKFPRRSRVTVVFGEPFTYAEVESRLGRKEAKRKFGEILMGKIAALMHEGGWKER